MSRLHYITEIEGWWMKEEGYDNKIMFEKRWNFLGKLLSWQNLANLNHKILKKICMRPLVE